MSGKSQLSTTVRKLFKRKLADCYESAVEDGSPPQQRILDEIRELIGTLRQGFQLFETYDKLVLRKSSHQLSEFCKQADEHVDTIVQEQGIEAVVPYLSLSQKYSLEQDLPLSVAAEELEKEACFILGLLAVKPEYQARIAQSGALTGLVRLLKEPRPPPTSRSAHGSGGVARRAADAITNLAHENAEIKTLVREQGGIAPLVGLLDSLDIKVQRAAAGALRTLAFKNEDNKNQIVECGALPVLVQMLRSEDVGVHYEAIGVIGNLVHSSNTIKRKVLDEGALQPVIHLLNSNCPESQRESALLLGQFATADQDTFKAKIVQRGAVPPLIRMLTVDDCSLKEMAAFALGRLAQNSDNQAGIVQNGGLKPLLELLESKHYNLQHNAAFALYGLADNEDNIPEIIKEGGLQRLLDCGEQLQVQASKDCVQKTISRLEQKLTGRVLTHVVFMLRSNSKSIQQKTATSLARLAPESDLRQIFVDKRGLDILLDMLQDAHTPQKSQREAAMAVLELARKSNATAPLNQPAQPSKTVFLGAQYVNNSTLADVTFIVEGRKFYAHRIALLASSDAFRAMFNSGYREKEASSVEIPNIPWNVFEAMMRYIYTGHVEVTPDIANELLQASDQYLLEGLKRQCEMSLAQHLTVQNVVGMFEASEAFSAPQLGMRCVLFTLEHYDEIVIDIDALAYAVEIMQRMVPLLRCQLVEELTKASTPVP